MKTVKEKAIEGKNIISTLIKTAHIQEIQPQELYKVYSLFSQIESDYIEAEIELAKEEAVKLQVSKPEGIYIEDGSGD